MKRREFILALGGAAAAWPLAARAQQRERMRRIGMLMPAAADDPAWQARIAAFLQGLAAIGLDHRPQPADRHPLGRGQCRRHSQTRGGTGRARAGRHPGRLAASTVGPLLQATRTVPIVFAIVFDPVGAGFVDSLARPGGNATGFTQFRIQHQREMAGTAQRDRAGRDARGGPSGYHPRPGPASLASSRPWRRRSGWR